MLAPETFAVDFVCTTCGKIISALTNPSHCPQCQTPAPDHGFPTAEAVKIAEQNDRFRAGILTGEKGDLPGEVVCTRTVADMGPDFVLAAFMAVATDTDFNPDNDPYGDHVFGSVNVLSLKLFWKIDLYDNALEYGSPDRADPSVTRRVLTIMFPSDW